MIDRNGVRVGMAGALMLVSGALSPVMAQTAARDAKSVVRVATATPPVRDTRVAPAVAQAAMQGDLAKVRALIAQQTDVNVAQGDGMTGLHWAADRGDAAMTALLLRSGAKLTGTTKNGGYTPLHVAARAGHGAVVQALLAAGADAATLTSTGATAMHLAAGAGDAASVKALLAKKADPNARESAWGQTPLMFAAAENRGDAARALLAGGADASIRTRSMDLTEELARQQAAAKKRNEVLFSYLPQKTRDSIIDAAAKAAEKLAADAAAARNRAAAAAGMAAPGAPAAAATPATPAASGTAAPAPAAAVAAAPAATRAATPAAAVPAANPALRGYKIGVAAPPTQELTAAQIQEAIEAGRKLFSSGPVAKTTESAELFEGQVAGYEATVGSMGGLTALHHAARQGNIDAALAILDGGGKINEITTSDSTTALLMAAINGHFDLAMALVKRGADVKIASSAGLTPLYAALNTMWAPRSRYPQPQAVQTQKVTHLELMDAMLKSGADVNVRLKKNLWFFAFNNCGNANCGLEALDGTTPFWRATYAVDVEAMKLLKAHGAIDTLPSYRAPAGNRGNRARFPGGFGEGPAAFVMSPAIDSASKAVAAGIGVYPVHAAAGVGYGNGFAGNSHRHATDGWMPAMKYMVEVLHADVNQRDLNGYTPLHHAAARGDNEMIEYLVSKGADPKAVARNGMTTVDMANGPVQRLRPFPDTIQLLEKLGATNSHRCVAC